MAKNPPFFQAKKQWDSIGYRHHHGIALPLFSLWTRKSAGIGEFLDLIPLIDWCRQVGFDVIQLLPLNDTGHGKSPYSALSAFALNPLHLTLSHLPHFHTSPLSSLQNRSNSLVDYSSVLHLKEEFLKSYFQREGKDLLIDSSFLQFKEENPWLEGYAEFKRDQEGSFQEKIFYELVQYLCFLQMASVKKYAESKSIFIKGDIPILISPKSADVDIHKNLFIHHLTAGAPPDIYSDEGQSWGFPLYDWERRYDEIIAFWIHRLHVASKIYHLYRLDHVVGLFRIFAIPLKKSARYGFFLPSQEEEWLPQGTEILKTFLKMCPMLPIGEDLGVVPQEIKERLIDLGIPGTKVMRWEMIGEKAFIPVKSYPTISMTTVSTHDTETLKAWWEAYPKLAKAFAEANAMVFRKNFDKGIREELLSLSHRSGSLFHINQFQEYFPEGSNLEFENEERARINDPSKGTRELNWRVRFKAPLEDIMVNDSLLKMIKAIVPEKHLRKDP